jgi:hypothetical protein
MPQQEEFPVGSPGFLALKPERDNERRIDMRVFVSFARGDADLAGQLEAALRRNNIEAWSALEMASGEDSTRVVDNESAGADGDLFLLGAGASSDSQLRAEWRSLLRNDWESKKPLIPILHAHGATPLDLPPFLRNRRAIFTTDFDNAIGEVRYLIEHPAETLDRTHEQESRAEREQRLDDLKEYALSLKEGEKARGEAEAQ